MHWIIVFLLFLCFISGQLLPHARFTSFRELWRETSSILVYIWIKGLCIIFKYYERDLIIIERVEVYIYTIQGQKGKSIETVKGILNIL